MSGTSKIKQPMSHTPYVGCVPQNNIGVVLVSSYRYNLTRYLNIIYCFYAVHDPCTRKRPILERERSYPFYFKSEEKCNSGGDSLLFILEFQFSAINVI